MSSCCSVFDVLLLWFDLLLLFMDVSLSVYVATYLSM